jgi:hypothetical protein
LTTIGLPAALGSSALGVKVASVLFAGLVAGAGALVLLVHTH